MLNRAYEVLRDPKLRESYDAFGTKGIGTSAASDIDNVKRRQARPSSSSTTQTSNAWASESTARTNGYASDFVSWPTGGAKAGRAGAGQRKSTTSNGNNAVDPFSVNKRTPYTPKKESSEWRSTSYQDPGFRPSTRATQSNIGREQQTGPKSGDNSAYYGDMGSVHSQRGYGTRFEDKLFDFQDGVTSGEAFFGRGPKFGRDVLIDIELVANNTRAGGKKLIEVKHMESCSTCSGTGMKGSSSTIKQCRHCGGSGYTIGGSMIRETCPVCMGTGRTVSNPCHSCGGLGMQQAKKSIEITVPRNVENGFTLRVPGEGDAGPNGGPAGDLYVCFKVQGVPNKAESKKTTGTVAAKRSEGDRASTAPAKKPDMKFSSGLGGHQPRAFGSVRPGTQAPPNTSAQFQTSKSIGRSGLKPKAQPHRTVGAPRPQAERVVREAAARVRPNRTVAASSANRRVVERSRVSPAQAQANRFGSTKVVDPNIDNLTSEPVAQPRRGRLRGLRSFVSNFLNR